MSGESGHPALAHSHPAGVVSALRRNGWAMLVAAAVTIVVQAGTYVVAASFVPPTAAVVLTLTMSLLWVVVAAPIFAAGAPTAVGALLRGGAVADASIVVLIVLVADTPAVSPAGAICIFVLWCSLVLAECSLVLAARDAAGRHVLAALAVLLVVAVAAGPFWANGIIMAAEQPWRGRAGFLVRASNPVFATTGCLADSTGFVWNERPILYEYTVVGRDVPVGAVSWYVTACAYGIVAVVVGVIGAIRRRR